MVTISVDIQNLIQPYMKAIAKKMGCPYVPVELTISMRKKLYKDDYAYLVKSYKQAIIRFKGMKLIEGSMFVIKI